MNSIHPEHTVLLIIDVQNALMAEEPYRGQQMLVDIRRLLDAARLSACKVVHVQHNEEAPSPLVNGSSGWQIVAELLPQVDEAVFQKYFNSAFKETGLQAYLDRHGIKNLIVCGMQTEYCIETTVRVAFEFGYRVILPQGCNSTVANGRFSAQQLYEHHNLDIMANRFAETPDVEQTLSLLTAMPV